MKTIFILMLSALTLIGTLKTDPINPERAKLLDRVFELLEENAANPNWISSSSYKEFKKQMYSKEVMEMEEDAFMHHFKQKRNELSFSHFDLYSKDFTKKIEANQEETSKISWKPIDERTAYLRVNTFVVDAAPMVKAVTEIGTDKYQNLIIDLRDNTGGSLDAPVVLGRFLTQEPIDAGVYLTKSWFEKNDRMATKQDIQKMPFLKDFTFKGISKMYASSDAFRMVLPPHDNPTFKGKVFVLINENTASACEPLIDILKKKKLAILVGETSAGNMLTGSTFSIDENYSVFIPISDYINAEGERIDQVGVSPNVKVDAVDALSHTLKHLIE